MNKKILVPIAQGSEEMEAVIVIDMLRRAGINVKVAGESDVINCSRNIKIIPDIKIDDIDPEDNYDAIILPGGNEGTDRLADNPVIENLLNKFKDENKIIGAICAAPSILVRFKILPEGSRATSHPAVSKYFQNYDYLEDRVVVEGKFITSRGAGTAFDFAAKLIEIFVDKATADKILKSILY